MRFGLLPWQGVEESSDFSWWLHDLPFDGYFLSMHHSGYPDPFVLSRSTWGRYAEVPRQHTWTDVRCLQAFHKVKPPAVGCTDALFAATGFLHGRRIFQGESDIFGLSEVSVEVFEFLSCPMSVEFVEEDPLVIKKNYFSMIISWFIQSAILFLLFFLLGSFSDYQLKINIDLMQMTASIINLLLLLLFFFTRHTSHVHLVSTWLDI